MNEKKIVEAVVRGFRKPLMLWLIGVKPRHGYDLITEFTNITGKRLKPSAVYPFLHTLEKKGYVIGIWITRGKRSIKRYSLTQKGRTLLASVKASLNIPVKHIMIDLLVVK